MAGKLGHSIFFDLETTDLLRVGQILNFCFLVIDEDWSIIDELTGTVKISPCQLPRASAIVANRTLVSEHQKTSTLNEREALNLINQFIRNHADGNRIPLIGYNSDKFDTHYLRASFLRNGIIPYLPVENKDLLSASRSLILTNEQFRNLVFEQAKQNLRLETLCKAHKLLDGDQLHESRADVELTIKLAQTFLHQYGLDIRTFEPYQLNPHHASKSPVVIRRTTPRISSKSFHSEKTMVHLLSADKASLWVDLEEFEKKQDSDQAKESIKYLRHSDACISATLEADTQRFELLGNKALEEFSSISMNDLFQPKSCYIEEWIYRLSYSEMDQFIKTVATKKIDPSFKDEIKALYHRYWLENDPTPQNEAFKRYVQYRYGSKMIVDEKKTAKGVEPVLHPNIQELYQEIETSLLEASKEDKKLLIDLRNFYDASPISKLLSSEAS